VINKRDAYKNNPKWTEITTKVQGIRAFINKTDAAVVLFHGKKKNPTRLYKFKSMDQTLVYIDEEIKKQFDRNAQKETHKLEKAEQAIKNRANVKVGDIFHTSWGYDQTNVEFFQVIEKPTPARVIVRPISMQSEDASYMSAHVKPIKDSFIGGHKKCTIDYNGNLARVDSHGNTGYSCEAGKSYYKSWYA